MSTNTNKLRRLMKAANYLRKNNPIVLRGTTINPSQALKHAWWFESFRTLLSSGIYRFSYIKSDGTIREAFGTLDPEIIPSDKWPSGNPSPITRTPSYATFAYYDIFKNEWRSFRLDHFIGFVEEVKEKEKNQK